MIVCVDEVRLRFGSDLLSIEGHAKGARVAFTVAAESAVDVRSCRSLDNIYFSLGTVHACSLSEMVAAVSTLSLGAKANHYLSQYLDEGAAPSFRCTALRDKQCAAPFSSLDVARAVGETFGRASGWPVSMKEYQCLVYVRVDADAETPQQAAISLGILVPHTKPTDRGVLHHSAMSLREPIAFLMVHLAAIQKGDVVLDPMVGGASTLLQVKDAIVDGVVAIGGDIDSAILPTACQNMQSGSEAPDTCGWDILNMDVGRLPMRSSSVDVIVCDMPFGKRCMTKKQLEGLYPRAISEMARVLREGCGRAVLLTSQSGLVRSAVDAYRRYWTVAQGEPITSLMLKHGGDWVHVFKIERSAVPFRYSRIRSLEVRGTRCYRCGAFDHSDIWACPNSRASDEQFGTFDYRPTRYQDAAEGERGHSEQ